jgi:hypothetical protein
MKPIRHEEFIKIYYDLIRMEIPFEFRCRGQSIILCGEVPEVILEADYQKNLFYAYSSTGS